jgi:hypothetical protein
MSARRFMDLLETEEAEGGGGGKGVGAVDAHPLFDISNFSKAVVVLFRYPPPPGLNPPPLA